MVATNSDIFVDVLIPCAGDGRYLDEVLASVCNQTWKNLRILVLDNGCGHTRYRDIVEEIGDSRVNYIHFDKRLPAIHNWNRCLLQIQSGFYCFIHDDDVWNENHIESSMRLLLGNVNAVCVLGAHDSFSGDRQTMFGAAHLAWWRFLEKLDQNDLCFAMATSPLAHMSSSVFRDCRTSFDAALAWNADQAYVFAHALIGDCIVNLESRVGIRIHSGNDTKNFASAYASISALALMRKSLIQLSADKRLNINFLSNNLSNFSGGMVFRVMQCCFSFPPNPSLHFLGRHLCSIREVKKKASLHSWKAGLYCSCPMLFWTIASLIADCFYFRSISRRGK